MEAKINIAKILKDKPVNTKLYSPLYGDVYFSYIGVRNNIIVLHHRFTLSDFLYNGRYTAYKESEIMLFPSKDMRDWRKFAWKKGDVLVCTDGKAEVIFERFDDDNYTSFVGKHYLESYGKDGDLLDYEQEHLCDTANYTKESDETVQCYINTIEERLGGKLNLETLEIEKPEFKDGDVVYADYGNKQAVFIVSGKTDLSEGYNSFIALDLRGLTLDMGCMSFFKKDLCKLRLATGEEKRQLFDALVKEGKAWDAEKKLIVDLKPKCEFKPFDKVLCRNSKDDTWEADFFARLTRKEIDYTQSGKYLCVGDLWMYCVPYNEETKHLLGTTDEWKGGEG